jgi:hypothetical protein
MSLNAQDTGTAFKTATGRPLENPKVVSHNPSGLMVKHEKGVRFIRFTELPESIRKKYNYDPEKSFDYENARTEAKAKLQEKLTKKRTPANNQETLRTVKETDRRIRGLEGRITFLRSEINRIDIASRNFMDTKARRQVLRRDGEFSWQNGKLYISRGSDRSAISGTSGKSSNFVAVDSLVSSYRNEIKLLELLLVKMKKRRQELLTPQAKK